MRKVPPPCEGCRPNIDVRNIETWEVYQLACISEMGISPEGVIATAKTLEVEDIQEVLYKVSCFVSDIRKARQSKQEAEQGKIPKCLSPQ